MGAAARRGDGYLGGGPRDVAAQWRAWLAVLARHHGVPFDCAAPWSTVDATLADGDLIPIEQRAAAEITVMAGRPIAPDGAAALNPAFDVTPARYVTGFVTDRGIVQPPFGN